MSAEPAKVTEFDAAATAMADDSSQFLTFVMAEEEYAIDILRVQEIKGWESVTKIPNTPPYVRGVLNLRGTVVPIVDLRARFGLEEVEYGPTTVNIVVKVMDGDRARVMGIVVDGVSDVFTLTEGEIKPAPEFGEGIDTEFLKGLATVNDKMVILLDIDAMLNSGDLGAT